MYVTPLIAIGPSEGVIVATQAIATPVAPYAIVSKKKGPITPKIPLIKKLEEEK